LRARCVGVLATAARADDAQRRHAHVDNRTKEEWTNVEVWLNTHYRITSRVDSAGGRL
jgi:hypothetical protein